MYNFVDQPFSMGCWTPWIWTPTTSPCSPLDPKNGRDEGAGRGAPGEAIWGGGVRESRLASKHPAASGHHPEAHPTIAGLRGALHSVKSPENTKKVSLYARDVQQQPLRVGTYQKYVPIWLGTGDTTVLGLQCSPGHMQPEPKSAVQSHCPHVHYDMPATLEAAELNPGMLCHNCACMATFTGTGCRPSITLRYHLPAAQPQGLTC